MDFKTALSWVACMLLLVGLKMIGDKRSDGFVVAIVAELAWIGWGVMTGSWALIAMSVAITAMYVRAIWQWKKGAS